LVLVVLYAAVDRGAEPSKRDAAGRTAGGLAIPLGYDGGMIETVAGVAFWVVCNALYYAGAVLLLIKNRERIDVRIVGVGAILIGPLLFLLPAAQLLFVLPLFSVFLIEGFTVPRRLPLKTTAVAIGVTALAAGIMIAIAMWSAES
jgi:hypothetical protein